MMTYVGTVEIAGCCLIVSAIEWLRYLRGKKDLRSGECRYLLPPLAIVLAVLMILNAKPVPLVPSNVGFLVVLTGIFLSVAVWLLVELGRFVARPRVTGIYRSDWPRRPRQTHR